VTDYKSLWAKEKRNRNNDVLITQNRLEELAKRLGKYPLDRHMGSMKAL